MNGLLPAGRISLGGFFVLAGVNKITNYAATEAFMEAGGLPAILLPLVIALEVGGGLLVAIARPARPAVAAALALAAFTVLTNVVFHRFWELEGQMAQLELSLFFKNLAIAGGLLMVAGVSADAAASRSARP